MRNRLGFLLCISGVILLIDPTLNIAELAEKAARLCTDYWPVFLILFGLFLCQPSKSKKLHK